MNTPTAFPFGAAEAGGGQDHPEQAEGRLTWIKADMVDDDPSAPAYIGAAAHTNNTGELSGMWYALERAVQPDYSGAQGKGARRSTRTRSMHST